VVTKKPNGYWDYDNCYKEAQKYNTRGELGKNVVEYIIWH
jgi:hypothetical protein